LKILRFINNKKGFTLIELLITLVILLLVIGMSYSFYYYVVRSFDIASKQSEVQQNVRLAKNIIENEVRLATYIKIGSEPTEEYNQRIYVSDGQIKHYVEGQGTNNLLSIPSGSVDLQLSFIKTAPSLLEIKVEGDINGEHNYDITSELLVLNGNGHIDGDEGTEVYFLTSD